MGISAYPFPTHTHTHTLSFPLTPTRVPPLPPLPLFCDRNKLKGVYGINVVPAANPDVVPALVVRAVEEVDPLCLAGCTATAADSSVKTAGYCRQKTANSAVAACAAPAPIHTVAWANPLLSNVTYDSATVSAAAPGDYIAFEWDDVVHDVWLVPDKTSTSTTWDPCTATGTDLGATLLIPQSHHATFDPTTNLEVPGRNLYKIPASAAGTRLIFVCSLNGHCNAGQRVDVSVGLSARAPDPNLADGVCPKNYKLCPDQSKQGKTSATVTTLTNVPWLDTIGADSIKLSGKETRASTVWDTWGHRKIAGKRCRSRAHNHRVSYRAPLVAGVDWGNKPVWDFPDSTLREVVEACSSNHPEKCVGISWKGGGGTNHTERNPHTPEAKRSYSGDPQRKGGTLGGMPGWIPKGDIKSQWMQLDLDTDTDINGVITQARGNNWAWAVTQYRVQYSTSDDFDNDVAFKEVPGLLQGPTVDYLDNEYASEPNKRHSRKFKAFFPAAVTARYVRILPETWKSTPVLRAEVLLALNDDVFTGKHVFRRCLETDGYTRIVSVGSLTESESRGFTVPNQFTKSVACPRCYQCREVPLVPNTGKGSPYKSYYGPYVEHSHDADRKLDGGFDITVAKPGTAEATLTVSLPKPAKWDDYRLSWEHHDPEFICRVSGAPLEPELTDDDEWVTFLKPTQASAGSDSLVVDAIADGFQPPEAVQAWGSTNQANLNAVYPPGAQLDPTVTTGPWHSRDWSDLSQDANRFTLPSTTLSDARGGAYWPPKPVFKVTFMPQVKDEYRSRLYPYGFNYAGVLELIANSTAQGWHIDRGTADAEHTNSVTGSKAAFGWRCPARMAWYAANWGEYGRSGVSNTPPYAYGSAREITTHYSETYGASFEHCPDGRRNAWEITVPNGVYMVTAAFGNNMHDRSTCSFENVLPPRAYLGTGPRDTYVWSVEVADGRFTLSASSTKHCNSINWLKLDLISTTLYPSVWLPAPKKEWWQLELDDATATVGLVEIRLPHELYTLASSYPHGQRPASPDCRQWWLYSPAKCYRQFMVGRKTGPHPDLATYPDFPGFTAPFLEWLFDQHDANGDGSWTYEEFRSAESELAKTGTYAMWERPASHNTKGTRGYHDDNAAHLFKKRLDVFHTGYSDAAATGLGRGDGVITKAELVQGVLAKRRGSFCDLFEATAFTHGGNMNGGNCLKDTQGTMPENWGFFNVKDGVHGFVVTLSNTPCTDQGGCPAAGDAGVALCEVRFHRTSTKPATVNCHGTTGKYLQIALPGDGQRLFPQTTVVTAHRSSFPSRVHGVRDSTASTDPALTTVCYGVVPRPVPAADDPNLLSATKAHPKSIVDNNPQDPIFWSTCYDRVIVKEWLPLVGAAGELGTSDDAGAPYAFNTRTQCLACDSVWRHYRANNVSTGGYNMATMITPRWWLQPKDTCADCNLKLFNIKPPAVCKPGMYNAAHDESVCAGTECAAGKYGPAGQGSAVSAVCSTCASGKYTDTAGQTACKVHSVAKCSVGFGYYGGSATVDDAKCTACTKGQYSAAEDASACKTKSVIACDIGKGFIEGTPTADNSACSSCTSGNFNAASNGDTPCAPWSVTSCEAGEGFVAGSASVDASCAACSSGTFSASNDKAACNSHSVAACPSGQGYTQGDVTNDSACASCVSGTFNTANDDNPCVAWSVASCEAGEGYAAGSASTDAACTTCSSGYFSASNDKTACAAHSTPTCNGSPLIAGSVTVDTHCKGTCTTGWFSANGVNTPVECTAWTHSKCSPGQGYSSGTATRDTTCTMCSSGTFSGADDTGPCESISVSECPRGQGYVAGDKTKDAGCKSCAPGTLNTAADANPCVAWSVDSCKAGEGYTAGSASADASCAVCSDGTFSALNDKTACNSHSVTECDPGQGFTAGDGTHDAVCTSCATGRFNALKDANPCVPWTLTSCKAGEGYVAGSPRADGASCLPCDTSGTGTFSSVDDNSTCTACSASATCADGVKTGCSADSDTVCHVPCEAGAAWSVLGTAPCEACTVCGDVGTKAPCTSTTDSVCHVSCEFGKTWSVLGRAPCESCAAESNCKFGVKAACVKLADTVCKEAPPCVAGLQWSVSGKAPCAPCKKDAACMHGVRRACQAKADTVCKISPKVTKVVGASIVLTGVKKVTQRLQDAIIRTVARLYGVDVSEVTLTIVPIVAATGGASGGGVRRVLQGNITGVRIEYEVVSTTLIADDAQEISKNIEESNLLVEEVRKTEELVELALTEPALVVAAGAPAAVRVERNPAWVEEEDISDEFTKIPTPSPSSGGRLPLGLLIGASVGGAAVLAAGIIGAVLLSRRKRSQTEAAPTNEQPPKVVDVTIMHSNPMHRKRSSAELRAPSLKSSLEGDYVEEKHAEEKHKGESDSEDSSVSSVALSHDYGENDGESSESSAPSTHSSMAKVVVGGEGRRIRG